MKQFDASPPVVPSAAIIAAWVVVALSWGPAAALVVTSAPSAHAVAVSTGLSLLSFMPWAIATPAIFLLCRRCPIGVGRDARSLTSLVASGLIIVPALVAVVPLVEAAIGFATNTSGGPSSTAKLLRRLAISALFSTPTYVAVIAVGQTLVWAKRAKTHAMLAAKSELRAIRAELSPHFTMNALGAIAQLAYVSAERAEGATHALADVLRSSLGEESDTHTLADELGAVEAHLDLYQHLTGGVAFQRTIGDEAWGWRMPRHVLVPLVENALTHGAGMGPEGTRHLAVRAQPEAGILTIVIENLVKHQALPSSGLGLGLRQVADRLRLVYGDRAALTTATTNGLFRSTVLIPND